MIQTEFEFDLPKGYVDAEGNIHRKGVMRLANARDEILPLQDYRVKQNRAYLVVILLSRVIVKLGEMSGDAVTPRVIEALYSPDLTYLQDVYRRINEDGTTATSVSCPSCGTDFEAEVSSSGE
ncbi:MAG: phage tail assembly protein [Planctomycetota bacterium]|nr:phage tail assembly protein [Planctomycetota bacterium]